ncbi:sigma factor [Streptomyces sp. NPDC096311]|uniref:sigma factor n=1 Tax=Streptomyces sp. NPDC096311 TaxID=3366083 RepID=UPI0037F9E9E3
MVIAYRVLGSAVEAEDVAQEVWLRGPKTDRAAVVSPVAFLSSATTRLAINVARSTRVRRETCIGRGCRNRSTRAAIRTWARNGRKGWNSRSCWSWRS